MFWFLLTNIGVHSAHFLRLALAGSLRSKFPQSLPAQAERHRVLLVRQPGMPHPDIFAIESAVLDVEARTLWSSDWEETQKIYAQWHPQVMTVLGWSEHAKFWMRELHSSVEHPATPMIVVSGSPQEQEVCEAIEALDSGAAAYLPRSLVPGALKSLIRSLLQKVPDTPSDRLNQEDLFCLDKTARRAWILGKETHFPGRLFDLLYFLAQQPDTLLPMEALAEVLYPGKSTFIPPNTFVVQIYRLRKLLEKAGANGWLDTVRGHGYRFSPSQSAQEVIKRSFR